MEEEVFSEFSKLVNGLTTISEERLRKVCGALSIRSVAAKTVMVQKGQVADELYFIQKGLMRLFYTTNDLAEITGFIFSENMFAGCLESFLTQQPSLQTMEALEPTVLLVLSKNHLEELYETIPESHIIMRKVMEHRFVSSQQILSSYILYKPEERYIHFTKKFPSLLQRVPQHIIASFLGITPVSLSRIRNRISNQG